MSELHRRMEHIEFIIWKWTLLRLFVIVVAGTPELCEQASGKGMKTTGGTGWNDGVRKGERLQEDKEKKTFLYAQQEKKTPKNFKDHTTQPHLFLRMKSIFNV